MIPSDIKHRFDELCAGRAIGDLSPEEERELANLCQQLGVSPDATFDLVAAAVQADALAGSADPLPGHLAKRLHDWADAMPAAGPAADNVIRPRVSAWQKVARSPLTGWAAAAAVLILSLVITRDEKPLPPAQAEQQLRAEANDLIERRFEGLGDFEQAGGTVIWSDSQQRGYMILDGVPANDPRQAQYQLWIVDPARDADAPVDGGVFDIPRDASRAVIPITAKLPIDNPQAFVITLEQPGGVVKSKQETVVALAKS
ncbi:MAG TPA: anti-sigma factor [Luteolibacter sp.]|nr:anti-sigma factor [Luteolibacter sp.]